MSTCRTCLAPVNWFYSGTGTRLPLDPEPAPDGNLVILNGQAVSAAVVPQATVRYRSHLATCPGGSR